MTKHGRALGFARKHGHKELHHHGGYAGKKTRTKVTFQDVGQGRIGMDFDDLGFGVQIVFARCKQNIAAGGFQLSAVVFPGAWVTVKVFMR